MIKNGTFRMIYEAMKIVNDVNDDNSVVVNRICILMYETIFFHV